MAQHKGIAEKFGIEPDEHIAVRIAGRMLLANIGPLGMTLAPEGTKPGDVIDVVVYITCRGADLPDQLIDAKRQGLDDARILEVLHENRHPVNVGNGVLVLA